MSAQLVLSQYARCIMFCWPQAQETKYWELKHSKSVVASPGSIPGSPLFVSADGELPAV